MIFQILAFIFALNFTGVANGVVSLNSSATTGFFRDIDQNAHLSLIYSLSYSGLHSGGYESYIDLYLNNDFYAPSWQVMPAQAMVSMPLGDGFEDAPFRKSRLQAGRQLLTEGFELSLLDGFEAPVYWSSTGGVFLYGGSERVTDLYDSSNTPLAGGSVFQEVAGFRLKAGALGRQSALSQKYGYGSISKSFEYLPLSPTAFYNHETDLSTGAFSQSASELNLSATDTLGLSVAHSFRNPRMLTSDTRLFVYSVLSQSAQETVQGAANWQFNDNWSVRAMGRQMRYNTGTQMEFAYQQEYSLSWMLSKHNRVEPIFGHILGYGGELWNSGLRVKTQLTDTSQLQNEISAAYLDKVNNIEGWAYQLRSGVNWLLASRWTASSWVEVERNHLFVFDTRAIANVTYYH